MDTRDEPNALASAAWAPLQSRRQVWDAVEGGAAAITPLALVHGWIAFMALAQGRWREASVHGACLIAALLAYYAVLRARNVWPSLLVLGWLLFELVLAWPLFGYRSGTGVLNWIALPLAILSVRAAMKRATPLAS